MVIAHGGAEVALRRSCMAGVAVAALAIACNSPDELPTSPRQALSPTGQLEVTGSRFRRPDEDAMVSLAKEVPGLAGYFLDSHHNIVAYVADSTAFDLARAAIGRHLTGGTLGVPPKLRVAGVVIRKGDYGFQQLSDWRDLVTEQILGTVRGAVYDDLDEARNRVTIGVLTDQAQAAEAAILAQLASLGVPAKAINFETTGLPVPGTLTVARPPSGGAAFSGIFTDATALNEATDTLAAGFELDRPRGGGAYEFCSLGMVLDRNGVRYVSTASHCGTTQSHLDPTDQWDQIYASSRFIGNEAWDTSATPRHSDVALIGLQDTVPSVRGAIGRTFPRDSGMSANRQIDTSRPFLYMSAASSTPVGGLQVEKEGRTTGWTYGSITNTCQDVTVGTQTILCEIKTSIWVGNGDSGSSLWAWDGQDGATLYGSAFSVFVIDSYENIDGIRTGVGGTSWFSSYGGFATDIGASGLSATTGTSVGSVSLTGSISSGNPVVSWTPPTVTNGNSSNTRYYLYRQTQVSGQTIEPYEAIASYYDATEYLDTDRTVTGYTGTTNPCARSNCVSYYVVAYNTGAQQSSVAIYFKM